MSCLLCTAPGLQPRALPHAESLQRGRVVHLLGYAANIPPGEFLRLALLEMFHGKHHLRRTSIHAQPSGARTQPGSEHLSDLLVLPVALVPVHHLDQQRPHAVVDEVLVPVDFLGHAHGRENCEDTRAPWVAARSANIGRQLDESARLRRRKAPPPLV